MRSVDHHGNVDGHVALVMAYWWREYYSRTVSRRLSTAGNKVRNQRGTLVSCSLSASRALCKLSLPLGEPSISAWSQSISASTMLSRPRTIIVVTHTPGRTHACTYSPQRDHVMWQARKTASWRSANRTWCDMTDTKLNIADDTLMTSAAIYVWSILIHRLAQQCRVSFECHSSVIGGFRLHCISSELYNKTVVC